MSGADRLHWDEIYRERKEPPFPSPDTLLLEYAPPVKPGTNPRALDLACGLGQNGLWLAEQGYIVDLIDISRIALLQARDEAAQRELTQLNFYPFDLDLQADFDSQYDLVCVFRYLNRDLFTHIRHAVKPGGRVIYETFNQRYRQRVPNFNPNYLLAAGELAGYFADWKLLTHLEDGVLSRLVAIKPG